MKDTISGFLKDSKGHYSMTRLCTLLLILGGLTTAYINPDNETLILGMITLGLGGKIAQKHIEK